MRFLLIILLIAFTCTTQAEDKFFGSSSRGWHWYEDRNENIEKEVIPQVTEPTDPTEQIKAMQSKMEKTLHKAIVTPTEKNIIDYITAQEKILNQSERFAVNWKKVLYTHPELDRNIKHPTNQSALHVYHGENNKKKTDKVKQLAKEYGLIFFYKGSCPYCREFVPVVNEFAKKFNWSVLGVSLDGIQLNDIAINRPDNGIAKALNITVVPALIAVHPKTQMHIPIAYGFISHKEMEERINLLLEDK